MRKFGFLVLLYLLALLFAHILGGVFRIYVLLPWYDLVLHANGGAFLAVAALWFLHLPILKQLGNGHKHFRGATALVVTFMGGFVWEWLEFLFETMNQATAHQVFLYSGTVSDVITDLTADLIGGIIVIVLYLRYFHEDAHDGHL